MNIERTLHRAVHEVREIAVDPPPIDHLRQRRASRTTQRMAAGAAPAFAVLIVMTVGLGLMYADRGEADLAILEAAVEMPVPAEPDAAAAPVVGELSASDEIAMLKARRAVFVAPARLVVSDADSVPAPEPSWSLPSNDERIPASQRH